MNLYGCILDQLIYKKTETPSKTVKHDRPAVEGITKMNWEHVLINFI